MFQAHRNSNSSTHRVNVSSVCTFFFLDYAVIKCVQGRLQGRLKQTGRACFDQRAFIVKRITSFYLFLFLFLLFFFFFTLLTFLISCEFKHACILGFFPLPSLHFFLFLRFFFLSFKSHFFFCNLSSRS